MGRRSRKRGQAETAGRASAATTTRAERDAARARRAAQAAASGEPAQRRRRSRRAPLDERPPAPWGGFPLVELVVLGAIVLFVGGLIVRGTRGGVMVACALALGSLAGLELSIREHFAGYRSHTTLLAGAAGVASGMLTFFLAGRDTGRVLFLPVGLVVFAAAFWVLRRAFKRRSGGVGFRV
jgi:hypothetical protein